MKLKITRKHDFHEGKTKCIMDILFEDFGIAVSGVKAIEGPRGLFFTLPQRSYKDREDNTKYSNIVALPLKEDYFKFQDAIKNAYNSYGAGTQQSQPLPPKAEIAESTCSGYYTNTQANVQRATPMEATPSVTFGDDLPF